MKKIAALSDIPAGQVKIVTDPDGKAIALFNIDGEIFALENSCPHAGGSLGDGELHKCVVTCPLHAWEFNVKTGNCLNMPGEQATKVAITVQDGNIYCL